MKPVDDTGSPSSSPVGVIRLRRVPGGRHRQLIVRLSDDEHGSLCRRAAEAGVSMQRYLVEAGLSGGAGESSARRGAERELAQARGLLRAAGNNLNQLAKWANANHAIPPHIESVLDSVARATAVVADRADELASTFEASS